MQLHVSSQLADIVYQQESINDEILGKVLKCNS